MLSILPTRTDAAHASESGATGGVMTLLAFTARGIPKGQPRPRAFVRKTSFGPIARVYDAGTAEAWKSAIAEAARAFIPAEPLAGALVLDVELWMPRPLGHFVASKRERGLKARAPRFHESKPDCDNCLKPVADALTVLRFWHDDAQVVEMRLVKVYEDPATGPGALIRIERPAAYVEKTLATAQQLSFLEGASR